MFTISYYIYWPVCILLFIIVEIGTDREAFQEQAKDAGLWVVFGYCAYYFKKDSGFNGIWFFAKLILYLFVLWWLFTDLEVPGVGKPLFNVR